MHAMSTALCKMLAHEFRRKVGLDMNKRERRIYKKVFRQDWRPAQPLISLAEESRRRWAEDGESCKEYGFIYYDGETTDQEVHDWMYENIARHVSWPVQWDCSGQLFTQDIHWKILGNGLISFVHTLCLDV